ncbi:uncharacterized protein H6S33_004922 [Morchella sextelata]|uniref:uncharacterized protein n=1 Tax=Morchella sextelata TaxID=1174677 RepID=UPI001D042162|nr:uncharacterized protein H6S33_004922 [Morchella sextelata]KAH0604940.1 hypothetical protein H6S33_004922 [Morchella sextelata]
MRLGSETIALLTRTIDTLDHQTSHAQHALLSVEELKCALLQLMATVEAAGKPAEAERVWAEGEKANKTKVEVERVERETESVKADADRAWKEAERSVGETETLMVELGGLGGGGWEAEGVGGARQE